MSDLKNTSSVPVVLVCEEEFIAVPLHVLVKQSTVFKSMFSSYWRGSPANESPSDEVIDFNQEKLCTF